MNCVYGPKLHWIPSHYFLYYPHVHIASLGPKTSWEAMIECEAGLYLQCTLENSLPFLLKSLYLQSIVGLKELYEMLTHLKYGFKLLHHIVLSTSSTLFIIYHTKNK